MTGSLLQHVQEVQEREHALGVAAILEVVPDLVRLRLAINEFEVTGNVELPETYLKVSQAADLVRREKLEEAAKHLDFVSYAANRITALLAHLTSKRQMALADLVRVKTIIAEVILIAAPHVVELLPARS